MKTKNAKNNFLVGLISEMSVEEKIGALLTLGFAGTIPKKHIFEYIEKYHCGGLRLSCDSRIFGSYVNPNDKKTVVALEDSTGIKYGSPAPVPTVNEYKEILDELQTRAKSRPHGIPLHFSFDQEGGTSADFFFGGVNLFPKPMGLRATNDVNIAYEVALAVSKQSRAVGFNWVHSPVLDVNTDPRNPEIYTRSFSDDAEVVAEYAIENCRGFKDGGLIATGKHFPGRGDSDIDAHFKIPVIDADKETLLNRELLPYIKLIERDLLPSIMLAHSIFPAIDDEQIATVSKKIITGLLREEMGFEGVIATDSMTMGAIATQYGVAEACALSLEAGADLILMKAENNLVSETVNAIRRFIDSGKISAEDLDSKVYRVLSLKYEYGLFSPQKEINPQTVIDEKKYHDLAALVAKRSVLIERKDEKEFPLKLDSKVLVIEQKIKNYNTMQWHSGILFENCDRISDNVFYLETAYTYDEDDKKRFLEAAEKADVVVVTNYYIRGKLCNKLFLEDFISKYNKPVIVVTNTPYVELSIPKNSKNVIVTFATSPENIKVTAKTLFGDVIPEGVWPLENYTKGRA